MFIFDEEFEPAEAWDCDPFAVLEADSFDQGLDETDDEGDWQVIALHRWGDRMLRSRATAGDETRARSW